MPVGTTPVVTSGAAAVAGMAWYLPRLRSDWRIACSDLKIAVTLVGSSANLARSW